MKVCNICKEIKSIDCFGKNIALKSGINSNCKECVCLKASEWHAKNYKKKKYKKVDSLPNEIWKKYQENIYVSNFGRVKNLNFKNSDSEKLLKLYKSNKGYISTVFYINKKRTVFRVNRLVILVFKGYKKGYEVDHKNGLKHDNSLSNLRYCRQEDNKRFNNHNRIKTSKYVGVCFIKKELKWSAEFTHNKVKYLLGRFDTELKAKSAYDIKFNEIVISKNKNLFKNG